MCSENKGTDQLRCYREADLRLCFRICKKPVFSRRGSNYLAIKVEDRIANSAEVYHKIWVSTVNQSEF